MQSSRKNDGSRSAALVSPADHGRSYRKTTAEIQSISVSIWKIIRENFYFRADPLKWYESTGQLKRGQRMDTRAPAAHHIPAGKRDPEARQRRLLQAATKEFAAKGLEGARVDKIAKQAGVNKQLVYHYFGNKEGLYLRVLEETYAAMTEAKKSLNLRELSPPEAVERLVDFTFEFYVNNRDFVALLNDENIHEARHLRQSMKIHAMYSGLLGMIEDMLRRGERDGSLRPGLDTVQFYITLSGMCYFYFANVNTLSVVFDRDLTTEEAVKTRRQHIIDTVMASVRP